MANNNTKSEKVITPAMLAGMIICGVILVAVIVFSVFVRSGFYLEQQTAVTVGDESLNAVEYGYFYANSYSNFVNTYYSYLSYMGYDPTLPPASQTSKYGDQTWVEYFNELATEAAVQQLIMIQEGEKAGFTVDEAERDEYVNSAVEQIKGYASSYGYSVNKYLEASYGKGMNETLFRERLADEFYSVEYNNHLYDSIEVSDEEAETYKDENLASFTTFNGRIYSYSFTANDENSKAAALEDAKALVAAATSSDAFEQHVKDEVAAKEAAEKAEEDETGKDLELEENETEEKDLTAVNNSYVNVYDDQVQEWILSADRVEGDVEYFETTASYIVVYYENAALKDYNLREIEYIQLGYNTVSDDEDTEEDESEDNEQIKADALASIQEVVDQFNSGDKTRESFVAICEEKTSAEKSSFVSGTVDSLTNEGRSPEVEAWVFDEARKPGDVDIVEATNAYFAIYYVGEVDSFWKVSAVSSVTAEKYEDMYEALEEAYAPVYNEEAMDRVTF